DDRSIELSATPWSEPQPLKKLEEARPEQAFVLHTDRIVLRQIRDRQQMIGPHRRAWAELYSTLPDLEKKPRDVLAQNQKRIVDPNAESRGTTYKKLSQAVEDAQPGDVILIRYTGLLREDPVQIKDANANLTIRPYDNSHPILAIGQSPDQDTALVRVHDGRVTFENMEFRLAPDKAGYRAQSVAMVMGDGQCSFTNCVVTLEP